jgi:hypothetical protein
MSWRTTRAHGIERRWSSVTSDDHNKMSKAIGLIKDPDLTDQYNSIVIRDVLFLCLLKKKCSLRPIILFANMDVSRHILLIDTSVLVKSNMGRREYYMFLEF